MISVKTAIGVDNVTIPTSEYTAMKNEIAQLLAPKVVFSQASSVGNGWTRIRIMNQYDVFVYGKKYLKRV